jgi:hypothetical protein
MQIVNYHGVLIGSGSSGYIHVPLAKYRCGISVVIANKPLAWLHKITNQSIQGSVISNALSLPHDILDFNITIPS